MATKMITRTMTVYTYTFGKFNPATMSVENVTSYVSGVKMGKRELNELQKRNGTLLNTTETETLIGVTYDTFMEHGWVLDEKGNPVQTVRDWLTISGSDEASAE